MDNQPNDIGTTATDLVPTPPADGPDFKSLYEQAQAKLTRAEQTARDHSAKANRLDELEAAQQTEAEKATARAEQAEAAAVALRRRAVDAEIRAAATGWADPSDAPRYLDDRDRYVSADGEIDTAAIGTDLAAVLTARPHLTRAEGPRRPAPDLSQGPRPGGPAGGVDAQITAAEQAGDWATAITLKNQRLAEMARKQP
ncbi:ORF2 [Alloactinosynnema sp. L-07]|uniref:hypothetical protein n=1 Tax=Alloactinosynnema sp. L-07 TaxID=1653480 RepID=UPI00065EF139|nr:hypothetical protein [Alloactinosynnema sp. L-07]CRK55435.1 ORF2 [Alloactinosynnema sp. L-07]